MWLIFILQLILFNEIHVIRILFVIQCTEKEPDAADEVGDDDGDDNESENFVNIKHHVLGHNLLVSWLVAHQRLQNLLELWDIDQFDQPWKPK